MEKNDLDYELIDEISDLLQLNKSFEQLNFEQKKEIIQLHNDIIRNRNKKDYNELISRINSKLEQIGNDILYLR